MQHQWETLRRAAEEDFISRAVSHLSTFCQAHLVVNTSDLRSQVVEGIQIARRYAVTNEIGVVRFLETRCLLGPDFPQSAEHDWAIRLMQCDSADMDRTMEYIRDTALQRSGRLK